MAHPFPDALPAGNTLLQYRIEKVLGQGGFGLTYLAMDAHLDMQVALKEFFPQEFAVRENNGSVRPKTTAHRAQFEAVRQGFLDEAKTLARFRHPNIVQVLNFFEDNGTAYMVMTFEEGESLSSLLKTAGRWSETNLLKLVKPLLDGLNVLHASGFIHRDIKPGNIYIRRNGTPVLLDFGATRQAMGEHTKTLTAMLTPGYAPMEQYYSSSKRQGPWTDIYAMAAVLYRAITGKVPDHATDRSSAKLREEQDPLPPLVSLGLRGYSRHYFETNDLALQVLEKDRPQSLAASLYKVQGVAEPGTVAPTVMETILVPQTKTPLSNRWLWFVLPVLLLGAAGYASFYTRLGPTEPMMATKTVFATKEEPTVPDIGTGILRVTSSPPGALVLLDGKQVGTTPYQGDETVAGSYQLRLEKRYFEPVEKMLELAADSVEKRSFTLTPGHGKVIVLSTPAEAMVFLNGNKLNDKTPLTLDQIPAGQHQLILRKDHYFEKTLDLEVLHRKTVKMNVSLAKGDLINHEGQWISPTEQDRINNTKQRTKTQLTAEARRNQILDKITKLEAQQKATEQSEKEKVDTLIAAAKNDLIAKRLTRPRGQNALEKYQKLLTTKSGRQQGEKGIEQISKRYVSMANRAMKHGKLHKAEEFLAISKNTLQTLGENRSDEILRKIAIKYVVLAKTAISQNRFRLARKYLIEADNTQPGLNLTRHTRTFLRQTIKARMAKRDHPRTRTGPNNPPARPWRSRNRDVRNH